MSASRRRTRTRREPAAIAPGSPAAQPQQPSLPQWRWRTFPVFLSAALALFVGVQVGAAVGAADGTGPYTIASMVTALILSFGLSRLVTRWMQRRGWIRPRPQKRR